MVGSSILGSATNNSVSVNTLAEKGMEVIIDYGTKAGSYDSTTAVHKSEQGEPIVTELAGLNANTRYYFRVSYKKATDTAYTSGTEHSFYTQRAVGSTFSFGVQGDSHPERAGKMFNADLYNITMRNAFELQPDLYYTMGDLSLIHI